MFHGHETSSEAQVLEQIGSGGQVLVEKLSCFRCSSHLWHIPPPTQLEDFVKSFFPAICVGRIDCAAYQLGIFPPGVHHNS